jgi:hypothetical protein
MNYRKHKQTENIRNRKMYTPEGYLKDPPDSKCPYCGKSGKSCSHVNSVSRAWARDICKKKYDKENPTDS